MSKTNRGAVVHQTMDESRLTDELRELKEHHPEGLLMSTVRLSHDQGEIPLVWRPPKYADAEAFITRSANDQVAANGNLARSLAVGASSQAAVEKLCQYPLALARWIDREVNPFFGGGATTETLAL